MCGSSAYGWMKVGAFLRFFNRYFPEGSMKADKIQRLVKLVAESEVDQLEMCGWGQRLRIIKCMSQRAHIIEEQGAELPAQREASIFISPTPLVQVQEQVSTQDAIKEDNNRIEIRSSMVGTFYRASAPDQPPYIEVGGMNAPGQVLCVIEAMKMMNEIQVEVGGRVADISVENGQPVEYNQVLFRLESQ